MEILTVAAASGEIFVAKAEVVIANSGNSGEVYSEEGMVTDPMAEAGAKDSLLSSWPFVIGISAGVLAISIVIGVLLAKLKIKKGIDLYED